MKRTFHLLLIASFTLLFQSACAKTSDREYVSQDPSECADIAVSCQKDQHPFYGDKGCGCMATTPATADSKRYYVNSDPKVCSALLFKCPAGRGPFFDEKGCGCQVSECTDTEEKKLLSNPADYQKVEIKEASVSFEIPKNWVKQGDNNVWMPPDAKGVPLIGFKWENIQSKNDWEPNHILPKQASLLGPYTIALGWEQGLLYFVQIHDAEKKVNKFEVHTIIPRMEAGIAYDFYASADTLEQLKSIDSAQQHFIQSGELSSIKRYISKDTEECQNNQELNCDDGEQEFYDDTGCGCEIKPVEDGVYDN